MCWPDNMTFRYIYILETLIIISIRFLFVINITVDKVFFSHKCTYKVTNYCIFFASSKISFISKVLWYMYWSNLTLCLTKSSSRRPGPSSIYVYMLPVRSTSLKVVVGGRVRVLCIVYTLPVGFTSLKVVVGGRVRVLCIIHTFFWGRVRVLLRCQFNEVGKKKVERYIHYIV